MLMNNELAQWLTNGRPGSVRPLVINKAHDTTVPLNYQSSPAEVQEWLRAKGFSEKWVFLSNTHPHQASQTCQCVPLFLYVTMENLPAHLVCFTISSLSLCLSLSTADDLGVLTGPQLFSLTKEELCKVSPQEGARVYSQIMVQKAQLEVTCLHKHTQFRHLKINS